MQKFKVPDHDLKHLDTLNYLIVREHMFQIYWLKKYGEYVSYGIEPAYARILLIKKYLNGSLLYKYIYGGKVPPWIQKIQFTEVVKKFDQLI